MLRISGHSDDIVSANIELETKCSKCGHEIEEPTQAVVGDKGDEISAYEQKVYFTIGSLEAGVVVTMIYGPAGCWAAMVHQVAEDAPIPWDVRIKAQGYTAIVEVDCPTGTPVLVRKESAS